VTVCACEARSEGFSGCCKHCGHCLHTRVCCPNSLFRQGAGAACLPRVSPACGVAIECRVYAKTCESSYACGPILGSIQSSEPFRIELFRISVSDTHPVSAHSVAIPGSYTAAYVHHTQCNTPARAPQHHTHMTSQCIHSSCTCARTYTRHTVRARTRRAYTIARVQICA